MNYVAVESGGTKLVISDHGDGVEFRTQHEDGKPGESLTLWGGQWVTIMENAAAALATARRFPPKEAT